MVIRMLNQDIVIKVFGFHDLTSRGMEIGEVLPCVDQRIVEINCPAEERGGLVLNPHVEVNCTQVIGYLGIAGIERHGLFQ